MGINLGLGFNSLVYLQVSANLNWIIKWTSISFTGTLPQVATDVQKDMGDLQKDMGCTGPGASPALSSLSNSSPTPRADGKADSNEQVGIWQHNLSQRATVSMIFTKCF